MSFIGFNEYVKNAPFLGSGAFLFLKTVNLDYFSGEVKEISRKSYSNVFLMPTENYFSGAGV